MKSLLDIVDKNLIDVPLKAVEMRQAIEELVELYKKESGLTEKEAKSIENALIERELKASTQMDNSVAVPHARIKGLKRPVVVIGISENGVNFGPSGKSSILFLVLTPEENPSEHIAILSSIAKVCNSSPFCSLLIRSKNPDEALKVLKG